ncbi:hypothetical protein DM860_016385 [Cuscuta australis]|uniref:Uncharacterized protein n=1 Tax=Cuscuta australis TaxID=267555 RepID=A0A328DIL6_9ASTE|nr:hypothetical protein DM860_016385 [Cuscuta australis]
MVTKAVGPTLAVHLHHQPTKKMPPVEQRHLRRRSNSLKNKATIHYLFSDDYMFAPFLSSSSSSSSYPGTDEEEAGGKAKEEGKDFVRRVGEFLKCDCYLYTPLLITQPWLFLHLILVHGLLKQGRLGSRRRTGTWNEERVI